MSMLHDLEKQLAEIQDEIEEYFRRLKEHANLEKSFQISWKWPCSDKQKFNAIN